MLFPKTANWQMWRFPGSSNVYATSLAEATGSSAVMAPVLWIARTFPEAPPMVWKTLGDGTSQAIPDHKLLRLLLRPNEYYSGTTLWTATLIDWVVTGDSYWVKIRDSVGRPIELWWVPESMMDPVGSDDDNGPFIDHYRYRLGDGRQVTYPVEDVIHFRYGLDPDNPRKGLSPLASVMREVYTDDEASRFTATLLRNQGVPGILVAPSGEAMVGPDDVDATKQYFHEAFTGSKRGEPLVMSAATSVEQFGFSPQQMVLRDLRRIPEERITAVTGVPAIVANLGAGLDRSTFANMAEAREAAYEGCLIPAQRALAEEIRFQLLEDFEPGDTAWKHKFGFDLREVRVLQDDLNRRAERLSLGVRSGWIKIGEARRAFDLETSADDEIYLRPNSTVETEGGLEDRPQAALPSPSGRLDQSQENDADPSSPPPYVAPEQGKSRGLKIDLVNLTGHQTAQQARLLRQFEKDNNVLVRVFQEELEAAFDALGLKAAEIYRTLVGPGLMSNGNGHSVKRTEDDDQTLANQVAYSMGLDTWRAETYRSLLEKHYSRTVEMVDDTIHRLLMTPSRLPTKEAVDIALAGADRHSLVDIRGETLKGLVEAFRIGRDDKRLPPEIAKEIRRLVPAGTWVNEGVEYRANLIARAETANAQRLSSITVYENAGMKQLVAFDGTADDACKARNGQQFTTDQARNEMGKEHPSGTLMFAPAATEVVSA